MRISNKHHLPNSHKEQQTTHGLSSKPFLNITTSILLTLYSTSTFAMDKLKLEEVNTGLFEGLIKMLDTNLYLWTFISGVLGAVVRDGDIMARAKASGVGCITALAIWQVGKKMVGV